MRKIRGVAKQASQGQGLQATITPINSKTPHIQSYLQTDQKEKMAWNCGDQLSQLQLPSTFDPRGPASMAIVQFNVDLRHGRDLLVLKLSMPQVLSNFVEDSYGKLKSTLIINEEEVECIAQLLEEFKKHASKQWKFGKNVDVKNPIYRQKLGMKFPDAQSMLMNPVMLEDDGQVKTLTFEETQKILGGDQGRSKKNIIKEIQVRPSGYAIEDNGKHRIGLYFTLEKIVY